MTFSEIWWAWFKCLSCGLLGATSLGVLVTSLVESMDMDFAADKQKPAERRILILIFGVAFSLIGACTTAAWSAVLHREYGQPTSHVMVEGRE